MSNPEYTAPNYNTQDASTYKANIDAALAASGVDFINIGFSYSAGTFTITDAKGGTLSSSNPGFVKFQDLDNPGRIKYISVESNQSFIDDAGASEIIGNLFGESTGVAQSQAIVFYVYAVTNDDMDAVQFMLSRDADARTSPATANIGAPDDAVADAFGDFFSLDNITETEYNNNPCTRVGQIRMTMSASDDWTVQALSIASGDGVGVQAPAAPEHRSSFRVESAALSNKTGNGTVYTMVYSDEKFDKGNNFDGTSTFTADKDGYYDFKFGLELAGLTASATFLNWNLVTSNDTIQLSKQGDLGAVKNSTQYIINTSAYVYMNAGDTAYVTTQVGGEGADTVDIGAANNATFFSGYFVEGV